MNWQNQKGNASLLQVLVASVIGVMVLMGLMQMMNTLFKAQKHVEVKGNLESIRMAIQQGLNCEKTMKATPGTCPGTLPITYLPLRGRDNSVFLAANGASGLATGEWNIRSYCSATELVIEAAQPDGAGGFRVDPLTKRSNDWRPLFPKSLCPVMSLGTGSMKLLNLRSVTIGPNTNVYLTMDNVPACTGMDSLKEVAMGTVDHVALGTFLNIESNNPGIGGRGHGQRTDIILTITDVTTSTVIYDGSIHRAWGFLTNPASMGSYSSSRSYGFSVTPGHNYRFNFKLRAGNRCPAPPGPDYDVSLWEGALELRLFDYENE